MSRALLINGSPQGTLGNTCVLLQQAATYLVQYQVDVSWLNLSESTDINDWESSLRSADIIIIGSGTYWDSWGSPLQAFFERMTETEGTELWLGKPAGVLISMHSVGGKAVLSRLQGVLCTFGCLLPPMSGMVYSALGHALIHRERTMSADNGFGANSIADDIWRIEDIGIVVHNLVMAQQGLRQWRTWPVDARDYASRWL